MGWVGDVGDNGIGISLIAVDCERDLLVSATAALLRAGDAWMAEQMKAGVVPDYEQQWMLIRGLWGVPPSKTSSPPLWRARSHQRPEPPDSHRRERRIQMPCVRRYTGFCPAEGRPDEDRSGRCSVRDEGVDDLAPGVRWVNGNIGSAVPCRTSVETPRGLTEVRGYFCPADSLILSVWSTSRMCCASKSFSRALTVTCVCPPPSRSATITCEGCGAVSTSALGG